MIDTRIGALTFENGFPSEETTRKLFDEMDYQRATPTERSTNADGSLDLYFGPVGSAPAGLEANWIETVPARGFYPMFRFYSPKAGLFDGTWQLPDVELID